MSNVSTDNSVIIIDDLSSGRLENITPLIQKNQVRFCRGTILDLDLLHSISAEIDFVFHFAAIPSVPVSFEHPLQVNEANITGTLNVLLAAQHNNVKKVIFASSSSVYGDTPESLKIESMAPQPQSPYAITKLASEYYCQVFSRYFNLPTICLRYFNVFGAGQDPNSQYASVVPRIVANICNKQPR